VKSIVNLIILFAILILIGRAISNPKGTAALINTGSSWISNAYAAELGYLPRGQYTKAS
jgi:hypothetical protein